MKCVFVHGWGMNAAVWQPVIQQLPADIEPILVDLAGHGKRASVQFNNLAELTEDLFQQVIQNLDGPAIWIGWSLGALPVLEIARLYPELVQKLCLISANPCFVKKTQWQHGVEEGVFDTFAANLLANTEKTLTRFLSLQVQGLNTARETLRELKRLLVDQGLPSNQALIAGLDVLKTSDLRQLVEGLEIPQLWLLGEKDTLVPSSLTEYLATIEGVKSPIIRGSAHLPFVSHTEQVIEQLTSFIHA